MALYNLRQLQLVYTRGLRLGRSARLHNANIILHTVHELPQKGQNKNVHVCEGAYVNSAQRGD